MRTQHTKLGTRSVACAKWQITFKSDGGIVFFFFENWRCQLEVFWTQLTFIKLKNKTVFKPLPDLQKDILPHVILGSLFCVSLSSSRICVGDGGFSHTNTTLKTHVFCWHWNISHRISITNSWMFTGAYRTQIWHHSDIVTVGKPWNESDTHTMCTGK